MNHAERYRTIYVVPPTFSAEVHTRLVVRPNDLDSLGHVNNAVVLEYLEAGRWDWLSHNRLPRISRIIPVVARIEIDYRREILPPDVTVKTILEDAAELVKTSDMRFKCVFRQSVFSDRDGASVIAVEAQIQVAFVDPTAQRIHSLQDYLNQAPEEPRETLAGLKV